MWAEPLVWFCPLDPARHPGTTGSPQYMELFSPQAPWKEAASHVKVFKIYPQWIEQASDDDLRRQFADLSRRGIALALEYGVLTTSTNCANGISGEGQGGEHLLTAVRRIKSDGGFLKFVAMDEPIYFSTIADGKAACHWTPEHTAANAAVNIKAVVAEFPEVKFGDVEPIGASEGMSIPDMVARYKAGLEAFKRALGFPLVFFHADVNWTSSSFPANLIAMRNMLTSEQVPMGVIYDGVASNESDSTWISGTLQHMEDSENGVGTPEAVIFQSWHSHPAKLLPETDPDSFTWLIDQYFRTRTKLTTSVTGQRVSGALIDAHGKPLAGREVKLSLVPSAAGGPAKPLRQTYSVDDVIPPGTQGASFGIRVNIECDCSGVADYSLLKFSFTVDGGGAVVEGFASKDDVGKWPSLVSKLDPSGAMRALPSGAKVGIVDGALRVIAQPGQQVKFTSSQFPVNGTGKFHFEVKADLNPQTADSGNFVLIFLGAKGEIARKILPIRTLEMPMITVKTNSAGQFEADLPADAKTSSAVVATYAGGRQNWPTSSKTTSK